MRLLLFLLLIVSTYSIKYYIDASINFLPIQVLTSCLILVYYGRLTIRKKEIYLYFAFFLYVLFIFLHNFSEPYSLVLNPILPTMIIMLVILSLHSDNILTIRSISVDHLLNVFFLFFITYSLYINTQFILEYGLSTRFRAFGPATIHATISVYAILYYAMKYKYKESSLTTLLLLSIVPFLSIVLIQSRGALLALLITGGAIFIKSTSQIIKAVIIIFLFGVFSYQYFPELYQMDFISRLNINNYSSLDSFSSGRLETHVSILNWLANETDPIRVLLGSGLNEVKNTLVDQQKLWFPHFDLFYILYDGGIVSVAIYLLLLTKIILKEKTKALWLLFVISSFHTNMLLAPGFLALTYLMILNIKNYEIVIFNSKKIEA
jgi:hypothetical protein